LQTLPLAFLARSFEKFAMDLPGLAVNIDLDDFCKLKLAETRNKIVDQCLTINVYKNNKNSNQRLLYKKALTKKLHLDYFHHFEIFKQNFN
jgi:hypothetical protein